MKYSEEELEELYKKEIVELEKKIYELKFSLNNKKLSKQYKNL